MMLLLVLLEAPLLQAAASTAAPPAPTCHFMPKTDFWCLLSRPPPRPSSVDEAQRVQVLLADQQQEPHGHLVRRDRADPQPLARALLRAVRRELLRLAVGA